MTRKLMSKCQKVFCIIHGFSPVGLQVLHHKIAASGEGCLECDKRGKHTNHEKIGDDVQEFNRQHICAFSTRCSHYSRKDIARCVCISSELSIAHLYKDFLEKHNPESERKFTVKNFASIITKA